MREKFFYTAFGLRICSEIRLPLIEMSDRSEGPMDVRIEVENSMSLKAPTIRPFTYEISPQQSIFYFIPNMATFEITLADEIKIFPVQDFEADAIHSFLLGSVFGVILHRKDGLPLHGSAVKTEEGAIIFSGPSGIGKSTLATTFARDGHLLLTDDIAWVNFEGDDAYVVSSYPQMKLWRESLDALSISSENLKPLFARINKFNLPVAHSFESRPQKLSAIFILETHSTLTSKTFHTERIWGQRIYGVLHKNTYRIESLSRIGDPKRHFRACSRLAQQVPVYRLSRPTEGMGSEMLAAECLKFLKKERKQARELNTFDKYSQAESQTYF